MNEASVRWILWNAGRSVTCTEHLEPDGLELNVMYDSLPLATQHCDELEDALRWSDQVRTRWEALGWRIEPAGEDSANRSV